MRYNAIICLREPGRLRWAASQNNGHQEVSDKWRYVELIDLYVALKLSGQFREPRKNWLTVSEFAPILQLTGKTNNQMSTKFQGTALIYNRYFHQSYFEEIPNWEFIRP